jgi:hypothetical protein
MTAVGWSTLETAVLATWRAFDARATAAEGLRVAFLIPLCMQVPSSCAVASVLDLMLLWWWWW